MAPVWVSPAAKQGVPAQRAWLQAAVTEDVACQPAPLADQPLYQPEDHCPGVARRKGHENPRDRIDEDCDQEAEFAAKPAEGKKKREERGSAAGRVGWRTKGFEEAGDGPRPPLLCSFWVGVCIC